MSLLQRLQQPFPNEGSTTSNFQKLLGIGLFVSLFLYVIRPFGMNGDMTNMELICLGFGLVTVVCGLSFGLFTHQVLKLQTDIPSWTLAKWIFLSLALLVWIAIGNFVYVNVLSEGGGLSLGSFITMLGYTLLIGVFPIVFSGLLIQIRATRSNQLSAEAVDTALKEHKKEPDQSLTLNGLDPESSLLLIDILYIEAMQNYLTVWYVENGSVQKEVLRSTMTKAEAQLSESSIVRCHRSYLVNGDAIIKVEGNAQGLRLTIKNCPKTTVPVSRSYIPQLRALLG